MTRLSRIPVFTLLVAALLQGCTSEPKPRGYGEASGPTFEYTSEFVQDPRGRWVPSPKTGRILAVTRDYVAQQQGVKQKAGDARVSVSGSSEIELVDYVIYQGTHEDCAFGEGETGSYLYIAGRRWPRQRKHWVDTTCDATTVIIQEVTRADGSHTDRVFLLWDGRPPTDPPSQVTVELVNNPGVSVVLTCGTLAQECYTETHDGMTLSPSTPLHPSGAGLTGSSAVLETFVSCVKEWAAAQHVDDALKWQQSGGSYMAK